MKTGKFLTVLALILALGFGSGTTLFVMNSCDSSGGDDGGAGADVDLSNYYTKAQVDSMLPIHGQNETFGITAAHSSYTTGQAVTVPTGYRYLFVQASGGDTGDSSDICIGVSDSDNYTNTLPPYGGSVPTSYLLFFNLESYQSGGVRIWAENLSESMSAFTALWIR